MNGQPTLYRAHNINAGILSVNGSITSPGRPCRRHDRRQTDRSVTPASMPAASSRTATISRAAIKRQSGPEKPSYYIGLFPASSTTAGIVTGADDTRPAAWTRFLSVNLQHTYEILSAAGAATACSIWSRDTPPSYLKLRYLHANRRETRRHLRNRPESRA